MGKTSAGLLLYRKNRDRVECLLVHPGGPFWAKKDRGAWSVPKGEVNPDIERAEEAARREFAEELGQEVPKGDLIALGEVQQKAGKKVLAWALEGSFDPLTLRSNTFEIEWPPKSGNVQQFEEIDRAQWFSLSEARDRVLAAQVPFVERLASLLGYTLSEEVDSTQADDNSTPPQTSLF